MLKGLGHIGILVRDLEETKVFYEKIGFEIQETYNRPTGATIAFAVAGSCILELVQPDAADTARIGRSVGMIDHVCVEVDDIDAEVAKLKALGIVSADANAGDFIDMRGGFRNFFFEGPSGERIEYSEPAVK